MTVGELKAALEDYGDHLQVVVVVERGQHEYSAALVDVDTSGRFGDERTVTITGVI
jgi:hypothetical protein